MSPPQSHHAMDRRDTDAAAAEHAKHLDRRLDDVVRQLSNYRNEVTAVASRQQSLNARHDGHEELCAERYKGIQSRLTRMEAILISCFGAVMLGLLAAIWELVLPHLH